MRGQHLRQLWESEGPQTVVGKLSAALAIGRDQPGSPDGLRANEFSIRELAESFCGHEWVQGLNPRNAGPPGMVRLLEAAGNEGVDVSAFSNITGQLLYSRILEGWMQAGMDADRLVETIPTSLDGEKFPWIGNIPGEGEDIAPGKEYPEVNFGEQYIETPSTTKEGLIVSVYKETVFFDRTGQVLMIAGAVGERLRTRKNKKIIRTVLGYEAATQTWKWKGTTYNHYQTSAAAAPKFLNSTAGTPLVDYTSLQTAYVNFSKITDPDTGNPIEIMANRLMMLVPPALAFTADRAVGAPEYRTTYPSIGTQGASAATSLAAPGNVQMVGPNPIQKRMGTIDVISTPFFATLLVAGGETASNADQYWYIGDFPRAFKYMQNWDITVVQAPANSEAEFTKDVVYRAKASERGVPAIFDPRYVQKFTGF